MTEKRLLQALKGKKTDRIPFWLMRQAGRYLPEYREIRSRMGSFLDLCLTPKAAEEVTLQPIRRFGMDGAILFSDILIVPMALGQKVEFVEGEGPKLGAVRSEQALGTLEKKGFHERLAPVYETVDRLSGSLPAETALIGFAGAPWTVATYMVEGGSSRDYANTKGWGYRDPEGFEKLLDMLVDQTAAYLDHQIQAGVEAVQIFDSWAGVLPERWFYRWVVEPTRRIVEKVRQRHPDTPIIGFPKGAGLLYRDYIGGTGVSAVSLDTMVPLEWAVSELQSRVAIQGNLDPQMLLVGERALEAEIEALVSVLGNGPYIFNLGHGIVPQTPVANVARLAAFLRS